ncbi:helix-turn-helix domain-containing protein [Paenibacillus tyrfis]|uniref:Uncharacterized protein n=1 Tax=Paenibacillus tyrfis TaxID=1501230 RepID=A0A081P425_9BACL|nr:helix-turn-helix domain-containing protein [Paenibacillus tyrfis]KEQ25448.1 hypothetical protein ET33_01625 [Paenibacillus tyrfis]
MAVYKWLDRLQNQFDYIDNEGAFSYKGIFSCEDKKRYKNAVVCSSPNNTYFLNVPQTLRRCLFLSTNEKAVLWELMSWMNNDEGCCQVPLKTLEMYTGLSYKTVGKMIQGLVKKGFIKKRHTFSADVYRICDLSQNPYILASECVYDWYKKYHALCKPDERSMMLENIIEYDIPQSLDSARKAVYEFVEDEKHYRKFINMMEEAGDFKENYLEMIGLLESYLNEIHFR